MIYYCNGDEDFIVGIHSVDRETEAIVRVLSKILEMDMYECTTEEYEDYEQNDFTHDTIVLKWSQLAQYAEEIPSLESKKINIYVVF